MRRKYTDKQIEYLRSGYKECGINDLTEEFNKIFNTNKSTVEIKCTLKRYSIKCGRTTGDLNRGRSRVFSPGQIDFIKTQYKHYTLRKLTIELNDQYGSNITEQQVRSFTRNHKINSGRTGQFEKGCFTWNKGTKGLCHGSSTSFRKGHIPGNTRQLYSERIDSKDGYTLIKVPEANPYTNAQTRFKLKHVVIWEKEHGPVPKGQIIIFKDGDKTNITIDNLQSVSRSELLRLNRCNYKNIHNELKPALFSLVKLEVALFNRIRGKRRL